MAIFGVWHFKLFQSIYMQTHAMSKMLDGTR